MTTDDKTPRDIAPKFTFREWTKLVHVMEVKAEQHLDRSNRKKPNLIHEYHANEFEICAGILKELKRAQVEGG